MTLIYISHDVLVIQISDAIHDHPLAKYECSVAPSSAWKYNLISDRFVEVTKLCYLFVFIIDIKCLIKDGLENERDLINIHTINMM